MMKKATTLILLAVLFSCGRLPLRKAEEVYAPALLQDMDYGVGMHVEPSHYEKIPEFIRLEIHNNSDKTIQFGADYTIERYDTDQDVWMEFGPPEGTAVIAIMYMLEPGKSQGYDVSLFPDRIGYTPGSYRISKRIFTDEEIKVYSAPFLLSE